MTSTYKDNAFYNLFIYLLIKLRISSLKINRTTDLSNKALQEISNILMRNCQLNELDELKPSFSDKAHNHLATYYNLENANALVLHERITYLFIKNAKKPPDFKFEPRTLFDICAETLCHYSRIDQPLIEINQQQKKIKYLNEPSSYHRFFRSKQTRNLSIPESIFERLMAIHDRRAPKKKFKERYKLFQSFDLTQHLVFYDNYIQSILLFVLECAIEKNNAPSIEFTFSEWKSYYQERDTLRNITPLHIACEFDAPEILIAELIDYGQKVNGTSGLGTTPLYRACMFNASTSVIDLLLKKGANLAALTHSLPVGGHSGLHIACHLRHEDLAIHLLRKGANINETITYSNSGAYCPHVYYYYLGATPLHLALKSSCLTLSEFLIDNAADLSRVTAAKIHVLHLACQYANYSIVSSLIKQLDHVAMVDQDGLNAADYALLNCNSVEKDKIIGLLKTKGIVTSKSSEEMQMSVDRRALKEAMNYPTKLSF